MRRVLLSLLVLLFAVQTAQAAVPWPWKKEKEYTLGASPTVPGYHLLDDGLGFVRVDAYDPDAGTLTLTFLSGEIKLLADAGHDDAKACAPDTATVLRPSELCALWGKHDERGREYHLKVRWAYREKKGVRVVVVYVRKAIIKLGS